ncbi:LOW QUALITY PROTEIN: surface-associated interspersed protein (SURFIN) [Plasmodium relictum]|uniref:Surface-associated interspersed protein (SURFIN) n=1 Tax=Plasmodium relictum TaxID=85471 RepID=A0A1J1GKL6_PLARL|nr:LOW QUALITY PROTEIN: surface-associated interspersed protein (SURFIN) [Plasmodium relictum]CRG84724.1 surface-associated interspersed protein (SURFIN) [Plasmodium relictum]
MNTEKKINKRKTRSASQYGHQYDTWKEQIINNFDSRLKDVNIEGDKEKKKGLCNDFNNNVDDTKDDFIENKYKSLNVQKDPKELWKQIEESIKNKMKQYSNLSCERIPRKKKNPTSTSTPMKTSIPTNKPTSNNRTTFNATPTPSYASISTFTNTSIAKSTLAPQPTLKPATTPKQISASIPSTILNATKMNSGAVLSTLKNNTSAHNLSTNIIPKHQNSSTNGSSINNYMFYGNSSTPSIPFSSVNVVNTTNPPPGVFIKDSSTVNTSTIIPIFVSLGSILGILLLLILLYRCTFIGWCLGNRKSKKKKKQKKKKKVQTDSVPISLGLSNKKSESNIKSFTVNSKENTSICKIILENEMYNKEESKENEYKEITENIEQNEIYGKEKSKDNEHKENIEKIEIEQNERYGRGEFIKIKHKEKIEKKDKLEEQNMIYGKEKSKENERKEKRERKENVEEQNEIYGKEKSKENKNKEKSDKIEKVEENVMHGKGESKKIEHKEKIEKKDKLEEQNMIYGKEKSKENEHKEKRERKENVEEQNELYGKGESKKNEHKEKIERKENVDQNELYGKVESKKIENKEKIEKVEVEQNERYCKEEFKENEHKGKIEELEQNGIYDKGEQKKSEHKGKIEKVEQNEGYERGESKKFEHKEKTEVEQNERYSIGESKKIEHKGKIEVKQNEIYDKEESKKIEKKEKMEVEKNEIYDQEESKKIEHKEKMERKENIEQNKLCGKEESKEIEHREKIERKEKVGEQNERNKETKSNIVRINKMWKWKTVIEIHMMVLEECQKEEWELNRREFLSICLEEFKEGMHPSVINSNMIVETYQEKITNIFLEERPLWKIWTEWNGKLIEKWKKEPWFKNLKKEWKKEVNKSVELIEKEEMIKGAKKGTINLMLERQKIIWKKWIQKQNKLHTFDEEELLRQLLLKYAAEEEMKKNIKTVDREKIKMEIEKRDKEVKDSKKNKYISRLRIEIHMMVLDECKREEWILNKKEFLKTCIGELKLHDNSDEKELLEVEEEIMKNIIFEKKKDELEKMKEEKHFIELKQEWKNKEKKYMSELNKENLLDDNEERIENPMLQKQKVIWKKHWEEIHKKLERKNKEECFIKLMDELKKREANIKEIDKINVAQKNIREDEIEKEKKKEYIQLEKKEEKKKHVERKVEEIKKKNNYMTLRKKPKRKTIIEIQMIIIEDCKQEEWELNKVEFLEICLNEWLKCEELIEDVMDKEVTLRGEKESNNVELEKQKMSKKWVERQRRLLEKWEKEEWFKNLKEEWKKEENMYTEIKDKLEFMDRQDKIESNPTLERKKEIWKQWLRRQRKVFIDYYNERWFTELLEEYEKERYEFIKENEGNIEEKKKNSEKRREVGIIKEEVDKKKKKEKLIFSMCAEIHMMVLDQCKKEEIESMTNEFLKSYIEQKKEHEGSCEQEMGNKKVDEIEKEREMNIMIERKKEKWECWKKENWFQELKLNWKKEMIHMKEMTDTIREEVVNPMLETQIIEKYWRERQRNILKKRNKQNVHERSMKKNKDEKTMEEENDEDDLKEWNITIL